MEEIGRQDFGCIQDIMCYTSEKAESDWKEEVPEEKKGNIMSIADRFREEGIQLGEQRGIQLGEQKVRSIVYNMLAEGQSIAFISRMTGLSEAEIRNLQSSKVAKDGQCKPH